MYYVSTSDEEQEPWLRAWLGDDRRTGAYLHQPTSAAPQ